MFGFAQEQGRSRKRPKIDVTRPLQATPDPIFAGVVRSPSKGPVAELRVERLEILRGGERGALEVPAFVDPKTNLEAVIAARRRHELPRADRCRPRGRARRKSAFDHREKDRVVREPVFLEHRPEERSETREPRE